MGSRQMKFRLVLLGLSGFGLFGCTGANTVEDSRATDTASIASNKTELESPGAPRLHDSSGRPLLPVPGPDYPLPYDEIIWPWHLDGDWISMRRNALLRMRGWTNMHPSSQVSVEVYTDYTDKGMPQDFRPVRTKARRIEIRTSDPAVLDNLKYFPETRELLILAYCSLDDALSVLHYMPHLRRLEVFNQEYHQGKPVRLSEESIRGIASLQELRFLRLYALDVDDDGFRHLAGMKNLLYMDLINAPVTSKIFETIATWSRIRYLKLYGLNFDQPLDSATARALDSLAGRIAILDMNLYCTDDIATRIHESLEAPFRKIRANAHLARQPRP